MPGIECKVPPTEGAIIGGGRDMAMAVGGMWHGCGGMDVEGPLEVSRNPRTLNRSHVIIPRIYHPPRDLYTHISHISQGHRHPTMTKKVKTHNTSLNGLDGDSRHPRI